MSITKKRSLATNVQSPALPFSATPLRYDLNIKKLVYKEPKKLPVNSNLGEFSGRTYSEIGIHHVKTIATDINNIYLDMENNSVRNANVNNNHVNQLMSSFETDGWIYTEPPVFVTKIDKAGMPDTDPKKKYEFLARGGGTNRLTALNKLRVKNAAYGYVFASVYEYDTPLAERLHLLKSNVHKNPKLASTQRDILISIAAGREKGEYDVTTDNGKATVKAIIGVSAAHFAESTRRKLFTAATKPLTVQGSSGGYRVLSTGSKVCSTASDHNMAYWLDKADLRDVASVRATYTESDEGNGRCVSGVRDGLLGKYVKAWRRGVHDMVIVCTGYISGSREDRDVAESRQSMKEKFDETRESTVDYCISQLTKIDGEVVINGVSVSDAELKAKLLEACPLVFGGFAPQLLATDADNGGKIIEQTMVDEMGKEYDYRTV